MNILALDTSTEACSVALEWNGNVLSDHRVIPRQHNHFILPMIQQLLTTAGATLKQLDAIVVGVGPGSFVGVRLAVSVAQGLAYGADLPLIGVSSLHMLAQAAYRERGCHEVVVAIDGHMRAFYLGHYRVEKGVMVSQQPEQAILLNTPYQLPIAPNATAIGNAWSVYSLPTDSVVIPDLLPNAIDALPLAHLKNALPAEQVVPVYLREASLWQKMTK
jgi:tRNA threonylcarbamoyladenosine biosynthesis protein TsaB